MGLGLLVFALFSSCSSTQTTSVSTEYASPQPLEHPVLKAGERPIKRQGYTLSWNTEARLPNWVAHTITPERLRSRVAKRASRFSKDVEVQNCPSEVDYTHSSYQRGHMAPAADLAWSIQAMADSFLMSNVAPQKAHLNEHIWRRLETQIRKQAADAETTYIVTGPVPEGICEKKLRKGICVPSRFFKAVLFQTGESYRAVAFVIPQDYTEPALAAYLQTVDALEAETGFDFFAGLPDPVENSVEAVVDPHAWSAPPELTRAAKRRKPVSK